MMTESLVSWRSLSSDQIENQNAWILKIMGVLISVAILGSIIGFLLSIHIL